MELKIGDIVRFGQRPDALCRLIETQNYGTQRGWRAELFSGYDGAILNSEISEASADDVARFERRSIGSEANNV